MSTTRAPDPRRYSLEVVAIRVLREPTSAPYIGTILSGPEVVAALARELIPDDDREHSWGLLPEHPEPRDPLPRDLGRERVRLDRGSHGRLPGGLLAGAVHVIVTHNHPSTDVTPSKEDVALTQQLVRGARLLNLTIHDHVIVEHGTCRWTSLASGGLISRT